MDAGFVEFMGWLIALVFGVFFFVAQMQLFYIKKLLQQLVASQSGSSRPPEPSPESKHFTTLTFGSGK